MGPLEVKDFSGGVTDYPLQGAPNRAEKMDNFLITQDNKIVVRDGYKLPIYFEDFPFEGGRLLDKFFTIENGEKLLVLGRGEAKLKDKYLNTEWINVTGDVPNGGQISLGEYGDTAYMASDVDPIPRKLYQNEEGAYVTRRVGLPQSLKTNPMTESSLLSSCLLLANDIRDKFIDHMEDYYSDLPISTASTVYTAQKAITGKLHQSRDRKALSYLQTETVGIEPNQSEFSAAPVATNFSTLFNLTRNLLYAFRAHVGDASIDTPNQKPYATNVATGLFGVKQCWYHWILRPKKAAATSVVNPDAPVGPIEETEYYEYFVGKTSADVTIVDIAKALNDLRLKYNNHRMGVHLHDFFNQPTTMDKYATSVAEIEDIYTEVEDGRNVLTEKIPPKITPDYTDLINFVNNLAQIYRKHIGVNWESESKPILGSGFIPVYHVQVANNYNNLLSSANDDFIVNLPYATTLEQAKLLFFHLRAQYIGHDYDARPDATKGQPALSALLAADQKIIFARLTADCAGGTTALTDVKDVSAVAKTLSAGAWLWSPSASPAIGDSNTKTFGVPNVYTNYCSRVVSAGSGTATLDRPMAVAADAPIHASMSKYHAYSVSGATTTGTSSVVTASASNLIQSDATKMPSSVTEFATMASELFFAIASHILDPSIHVSWGAGGIMEVNSFYNGVSKYFLDTMIRLYLPNAPFFVPEAGTVNYAFFFSDRYKVNQFQQVDRLTVGAPVYVGPTDIIKPYKTGEVILSQNELIYADAIYGTQRPISITNLPVLTGYDDDIKLNLYRTSLNGSVYFELDEEDNGITSYLDYALDNFSSEGKDALINRQQIYTTGGVVGFDQIEGAKYVHVVNNKAYYAGIYEDGKLIKNRLLQSINGAPDAVPASFFDDFDDEIVGLTSARSNLIVVCKNSIYREAGEFGETGQGYLVHEKISDVVGGLNQESIVQTEIGVFLAGTDGFYYTDGYQIIKLSLEIDETYKAFTKTEKQRKSIEGSYDSAGRRVWFSVKTSDGDISNKKFWVLHLNDGVKPSAAFTPVFGEEINHTTHIFWNDAHWLGTVYEYPDTNITLGPVKFSAPYQKSDEESFSSGEFTVAIDFDYLSCALDAGTIYQRKYATKMHVMGDNVGNANIQPYVVRDKNSDNIGIRPMADISYKDNLEWGQPSFVWGDPEFVWGNTGKMDEWRRFPRTTIRSDVFQVGFRSNANAIVYNSDSPYFVELTFAEVNNFTDIRLYDNTVGSIDWPADIVGMTIYFDYDDYETGYEITAQGGSTLTIADNFEVQNVGELKFEIRGKKKNQRVKISDYVVNFALLGDNVKAYTRGGNGDE